MAISKFLLVTMLLISLLIVPLVEADYHEHQVVNMVAPEGAYSPTYMVAPEGADSPTYVATLECGAACKRRCSVASRQKMCLRACGTCCARCNCVPPGTSGNQELCPCYHDMLTHHGKPKCP